MTKPVFKTLYNKPTRIGFEFKKPSLTEQSYGYETNINNLVAGAISSLPPSGIRPQYGDFTNLTNYEECLNVVTQAQQLFEQMPSNIRDRFGNNPTKLLEFVQNPDNKEEGLKLGIFTESKVSIPKVEIVNPDSGSSSKDNLIN